MESLRLDIKPHSFYPENIVFPEQDNDVTYQQNSISGLARPQNP